MQVRGVFPELNSGMTHGKHKIAKVMGEYKRGSLYSGSKRGPKVTTRKQAIAIALAEARENSPFGVSGRGPRSFSSKNPRSLAGRRAASHKKAYGR